jgi:hypothetical protein
MAVRYHRICPASSFPVGLAGGNVPPNGTSSRLTPAPRSTDAIGVETTTGCGYRGDDDGCGAAGERGGDTADLCGLEQAQLPVTEETRWAESPSRAVGRVEEEAARPSDADIEEAPCLVDLIVRGSSRVWNATLV